MQLAPADPQYPPDQLYLSIRVSNAGDRSTTITTVGMMYFESSWKAKFHWLTKRIKPDGLWVINVIGLSREIKVGAQANWPTPYQEPVVRAQKSGVLYCDVYHALSKKPIRKRVRF